MPSTNKKKIAITPDNTTTITDVMMVSLRVGQVTLLASFFTSVKKVIALLITLTLYLFYFEGLAARD